MYMLVLPFFFFWFVLCFCFFNLEYSVLTLAASRGQVVKYIQQSSAALPPPSPNTCTLVWISISYPASCLDNHGNVVFQFFNLLLNEWHCFSESVSDMNALFVIDIQSVGPGDTANPIIEKEICISVHFGCYFWFSFSQWDFITLVKFLSLLVIKMYTRPLL